MKRKAPTHGIALFGLPFLGVGLWLLGWVAERQMEGWRRASAWTPHPSAVVRVFLERMDGSSKVRHRWRVVYRYAIEGRTYESRIHDVCQDPPFHLMTIDRSLPGEYRVGEHVTAWVNPSNPEEAVLSTRVPHRGFLTVLALLLVAIGAPFVLGPWIARRRPPDARPFLAPLALAAVLNLAVLLMWAAFGSFGRATPSSAVVLAILSAPLAWMDYRLLRSASRRPFPAAPPPPPAP
jgi:hypothetical protein